jgi:large subunit ribosomal protein L3
MRSGVIAQKVGMTRVFTEAGEQVPVTVLKLDNCQVVAQRTEEKNGYTALQLGVGRPRPRTCPKPSAGISPRPRSSPSASSPSSASARTTLIPVGAEITADHFVVGQFVDVTGTSIGKGFAGGMKRWNFGGLRASTASRSRTARTARPAAPGSGQDLQEQEDGRPHGRRARVTTQNLKVVKTDVERGLILVEGAVPGAKGGWILVRDAVKRRCRMARRSPAFRGGRRRARGRRRRAAEAAPAAEASGAGAREQAAARERAMELTRSPLSTAKRRLGRASRTPFSASSRAPTCCSACVRWQLAKRQAGTHKTKDRREIAAPARRCTSRRAPAARATAPRAPQFRGGGKAFGPVVRSHAIDLPKKVRALALKHALSAKAKDGKHLIVLDKAAARRAKTKALRAQLRQARLTNALIIDGASSTQFPLAARNIPKHRRAAGAGHQRLRHPAARQAGADQGGRRSAGGALQMSTSATETRATTTIILIAR